jgi:hypothetical protein
MVAVEEPEPVATDFEFSGAGWLVVEEDTSWPGRTYLLFIRYVEPEP